MLRRRTSRHRGIRKPPIATCPPTLYNHPSITPTYQDLYTLGQVDPIARIKTMSDYEAHGKDIPRGFREHPKKHIPGKCDCGNDITSGYRCLDCFMEDKKGIPNPRKKRKDNPIDIQDLSGLGLGGYDGGGPSWTGTGTLAYQSYPWIDIGTSTGGGGMAGSTQAKYSICGASTASGTALSQVFSDSIINEVTGTVNNSNHTFATPLRKYK